MADCTYKFKHVDRHPGNEAARLAVYGPLFGLDGCSGDVTGQVFRAGYRLLRAWRRRVSKLGQSGYTAMEDAKRLQYARNCPPALFETTSDRSCVPCHISDLCPFCAARKARDLYERVWLVKRPEDRLIAFTGSSLVPGEDLNLLELVHKMRESVKALVVGANGPRVRGYFWSATFEPFCLTNAPKVHQQLRGPEDAVLFPGKKRAAGWRVTRSWLCLMRPGADFYWGPANWERMAGPVNRDNLVDAVAMVCRYPVGLFRGNVAQTVEFMNLRGPVRLNERGGCLRNKLLLQEHTDPEG